MEKFGNKAIYDYGYLLDNIEVSGENVRYRDINIDSENLKQFINKDKETNYVKINGTKYYKDDDGSWYSFLNGEKIKTDMIYKDNNEAAKQYYKDAKNFTDKFRSYGFDELTGKDAVDNNGNSLEQVFGNKKIFDFGNKNTGSIEDSDSDFNQHRLAVIRYTIESNLSIAIANYNNYSSVTTNFQMPTLKEDEWTKIINNVSIISFMQGLNIGGKVYNGYSIITNTKNDEVVTDESIYLIDAEYFYKPTDSTLDPSKFYNGILNTDFERKIVVEPSGEEEEYYFPKKQKGSYSSIVNHFGDNNIENETYNNNLYKYIDVIGGNIAKAYYTALGRERYSMYKANTNTDRTTIGTERRYEDSGLQKAYNN